MYTPSQTPAGYYSHSGTGLNFAAIYSTQCGPGTYSPGSGVGSYVWSCTSCPAGRYGSTSGLTTSSCSGTCAAGTYSLPGAITCTSCPVGTYGSTSGLTSVLCSGLCAAGYKCPAGSIDKYGRTSTSGSGSGSMICPVGTYSIAGSGTCTSCPLGTYGSTRGLTAATCSGQCSAGYTCPAGSIDQYGRTSTSGTGSGSNICPAGTYSLEGAISCTSCPAGTYGSTTGLTTATCSGVCAAGYTCPAGSIDQYGRTSISGSGSRSKICPAGYECNGITETPCAAGKYSAEGAANCTSCPAGKYGSTTGLTTSSCSGTCAAGTYSPAGAINCTSCPAGTYGSTTGLTTATCSGVCAAGYTCPAGSVDQYGRTSTSGSGSGSKLCPAGYACNGSTEIICAAGTYSPAGSTTCTPCPTGRYGSTTGLTTATCTAACAPGYSCSAGSIDQYGRTSTSGSGSGSKLCPAGYACDGITETICPAGKYSPAGATTCTSCPAGRYGSTTGLTAATCTAACAPGYTCPLGSIDQYGRTSTSGSGSRSKICPAGYECNGITETPCAAGKYSAEGAANCTSCPAGKYGSTTGLTTSSCSGTCAAGTYSPAGAINCTSCPAGSYGSTAGLTTSSCSGACAPGYTCPVGSLDEYGRTSTSGSGSGSKLCPAGYECNGITETICPAGKYSPAGATNCTSCVAGTYSGGGAAICISCAPGSYSPAGATSCSLCAVGSYSTGGAATCSLCPYGYYGSATGLSSSKCSGQCVKGYWCPAGSTNKYGSTATRGSTLIPKKNTCIKCPSNKYVFYPKGCTKDCTGQYCTKCTKTDSNTVKTGRYTGVELSSEDIPTAFADDYYNPRLTYVNNANGSGSSNGSSSFTNNLINSFSRYLNTNVLSSKQYYVNVGLERRLTLMTSDSVYASRAIVDNGICVEPCPETHPNSDDIQMVSDYSTNTYVLYGATCYSNRVAAFDRPYINAIYIPQSGDPCKFNGDDKIYEYIPPADSSGSGTGTCKSTCSESQIDSGDKCSEKSETRKSANISYSCAPGLELKGYKCLSPCDPGTVADGDYCVPLLEMINPSADIKCLKTTYAYARESGSGSSKTVNKWLCESQGDIDALIKGPTDVSTSKKTYVRDDDIVCLSAGDSSVNMYTCRKVVEPIMTSIMNSFGLDSIFKTDYSYVCDNLTKAYADLKNNIDIMQSTSNAYSNVDTKVRNILTTLREIQESLCAEENGSSTYCTAINTDINALETNAMLSYSDGNTNSGSQTPIQLALTSRDALLAQISKFQCKL